MSSMTQPHRPTASTLPDRIHIIGIGGAAMSGIATILSERGHTVSGSDMVISQATRRLERAGIRVFEGHAEGNIGQAQLVIATAAAEAGNVERAEAARRGVPVISRAQAIARLVEGTRTLAIAGSHGKTTSSAIAVAVLRAAGLDPTFLVGGEVRGIDASAAAGRDPYAVIEADEFARAFLEYEPEVAVITNVEPDHLDYFGSYETLRETFAAFARRVSPSGRLVICADSPDLAGVVAGASPPAAVETYSVEREATWRAIDIRANDRGGHDFAVLYDGSDYGRFSLTLPGMHNVANATGVIAAASALGLPRDAVARGIAGALGAGRRFDRMGEAGGIDVYDDYAHHPTEVRATLAAARARFPGRRIVVCFQPHTEARTRYLFAEFRSCFAAADALVVLDTFAARHTGTEGESAETLARAIERPAASYAATHEAARDAILAELRTGDVLFTMGAGDVDRLGPMVLDALRRGGHG